MAACNPDVPLPQPSVCLWYMTILTGTACGWPFFKNTSASVPFTRCLTGSNTFRFFLVVFTQISWCLAIRSDAKFLPHILHSVRPLAAWFPGVPFTTGPRAAGPRDCVCWGTWPLAGTCCRRWRMRTNFWTFISFHQVRSFSDVMWPGKNISCQW